MPRSYNYMGNSDFAPLWQPGDSVRLFRGSEDNKVDVTVKHVFSLPWHRHDFGTLTTDALDQDDDHLDMPDGYMAQYRYIPRGNFYIHLQHPGGVDIYRTNGSAKGGAATGFFVPPYDQEGEAWDGHDWQLWAASEFVVFQAETPRFDLYTLAPQASIQGHVDFYGIGYVLKKFAAVPGMAQPPVEYWVNGRPAGEHIL